MHGLPRQRAAVDARQCRHRPGCRRVGERIAFSFLESMKYVGDSAVVDILRKGEEKQFEVGPVRATLHQIAW